MRVRDIINQRRIRRGVRARAKIFGTESKPRLTVYRSNKYVYAQLIDDTQGKTLASLSTRKLSDTAKKKPIEVAKILGEKLADKVKGRGIKSIVFDKGSYKYHGKVKALAEGVRSAGIKF